jgi:hypothetical protein
MTKAKALKLFRKGDNSPKDDVFGAAWRREAWNYFTGSLLALGHITHHQYDTWTNPF